MQSRRKRSPSLTTVLLGATTIALLSLYCMPLLVGALISGLGLSERQAGLLASAEVGAMALASLALAPRVGRCSRVRMAAWGAAGVVAGQLLSAVGSTFVALVATRALAGLGAGAILAACNAALATSSEPDRIYARVTVLRAIALGAVLAALPYTIAQWGHAGAYLPLAGLAVVCLPLVAYLPAPPAAATPQQTTRLARAGPGLAIVAAALLIALGDGALWAFSERIGSATGMATKSVGIALAAATLTGVIGAGAAERLSTRVGRSLPLTAGVVAIAMSAVALGLTRSPNVFLTALVAHGTAFYFVMPYLIGAAAILDAKGRWAAAASGCFLAGSALGPAIGGVLYENGGAPALAWLVVGCAALGLVVVVPVLVGLDWRRSDRRLGSEPRAICDDPLSR